MWLYGVVAFVVLQRLAELVVSRRNTAQLLAAGGYEVGRGHYPVLVAVHVLWLISLVVAIDPTTRPTFWLLGVFGVLQVARLWVMASLGRRWTTRIIVLPGKPLIATGPYRLMRHPNYLVVVGEIAVLPLAFGAWQLALAFSILNAVVLALRVRVEDRALGRG